jgi:hypothetical protein
MDRVDGGVQIMVLLPGGRSMPNADEKATAMLKPLITCSEVSSYNPQISQTGD